MLLSDKRIYSEHADTEMDIWIKVTFNICKVFKIFEICEEKINLLQVFTDDLIIFSKNHIDILKMLFFVPFKEKIC